jgi:hypothetical protein
VIDSVFTVTHFGLIVFLNSVHCSLDYQYHLDFLQCGVWMGCWLPRSTQAVRAGTCLQETVIKGCKTLICIHGVRLIIGFHFQRIGPGLYVGTRQKDERKRGGRRLLGTLCVQLPSFSEPIDAGHVPSTKSHSLCCRCGCEVE